MRAILTVLFVTLANAAAAHPGHLAGLAGHDHWVAGGAIGIAIAIGLYGAWKGKKADPEAEDVVPEDGEPA